MPKVTFLLPGPVPYASIHVERDLDDPYEIGYEYGVFLSAFKQGLDAGMKVDVKTQAVDPAELIKSTLGATEVESYEDDEEDYAPPSGADSEEMAAAADELAARKALKGSQKPWEKKTAQGPKPWENGAQASAQPAQKGSDSKPKVADLSDF